MHLEDLPDVPSALPTTLINLIAEMVTRQFSLPQIVCSPGGSNKIGSHAYFLLIVAMVLLLWRQIVLLWHQVTMVTSEQHLYQTIILPRKLITGSIHNYLLCYFPVVGIIFEVLRINDETLSVRGITLFCHFCKNDLMPVISSLTSLTF